MRLEVSVLHSLARSGSTIFSRCLGSMDGVMLFSEVHPTTSMPVSLVDQARGWYGIVLPEKIDFLSKVDLLLGEARARGKQLVLRDWSHVDFVSCEDPGWTPRNFSYLRTVLGSRYAVRSLCLTRNFDDTWGSMVKFPGTGPGIAKGDITPHDFKLAHNAFDRFAGLTGRVSYEDFCRDPGGVLSRACEQLYLPFDQGYAKRWQSYRKVTGDLCSFSRTEISKI